MSDTASMKVNGADSVINALEPKGQSVVFMRALNKSITSVRAEGRRAIREKYTIKAGDTTLTITKANKENLQAKVSGSYNPLSLIKFKAKESNDGVKIEIIKGRPTVIKSGFIEQPKGKDWKRWGQTRPVSAPVDMVFMRDTSNSPFARKRNRQYGNYPVKKLTGPSVGAMLKDNDILIRMQDKGHEQLEKNIAHELDYYIKSTK